jgi:hypothetical protein
MSNSNHHHLPPAIRPNSHRRPSLVELLQKLGPGRNRSASAFSLISLDGGGSGFPPSQVTAESLVALEASLIKEPTTFCQLFRWALLQVFWAADTNSPSNSILNDILSHFFVSYSSTSAL